MSLSTQPTTATPKKVVPTVDYYDELAKTYESAFSHDAGLHKFIEAVLSQLPPHSQILDVGCGTGKPVSTTMATHGHQVLGIDLSQAMIAQCRRQVPNGHFEQAHMLEWNPRERLQADGIFCILSLFLLSRAEMAIMASKLASWLQPDGILCIGTIAAEDLQTKPEMFDEAGLCASGVEMTFMGSRCAMTAFTKEGWRRMLAEAGFEVFYTQADLFVPRRSPEIPSDDEMHYFMMARKAKQETLKL